MATALRAYTQGGAYSSFDENASGRIRPGDLADLVVLSQNVFTIDPMKIFQTRAVMTFVGGKIVYSESVANQRP